MPLDLLVEPLLDADLQGKGVHDEIRRLTLDRLEYDRTSLVESAIRAAVVSALSVRPFEQSLPFKVPASSISLSHVQAMYILLSSASSG